MSKPEEPTERLQKGQSVEALLKLVEPVLNGPLEKALAELGIHRHKALETNYPELLFHKAVLASSKAMFPGLPDDEALQKFGEAFFDQFATTMAGSVMLLLLRAIGIRRSMIKITQAFRSANNFTVASAVEKGPCALEVTFNHLSAMHYFDLGNILSGLRAMKALEPRVEIIERTDVSVTYAVSWQ